MSELEMLCRGEDVWPDGGEDLDSTDSGAVSALEGVRVSGREMARSCWLQRGQAHASRSDQTGAVGCVGAQTASMMVMGIGYGSE